MSPARANLVSRANAASVLFGADPLLSLALAHVNASRFDTNVSGLDYCYTSHALNVLCRTHLGLGRMYRTVRF